MDIAVEESNFLFKSKEPVTVDMVGEISPEKISKLKKSLFEFFLLISNSWVKKNLTKIRNMLAYCGIGFKQLQFQSLVLLSTTKKRSSYYDKVIENILNYIRFDLCFIEYASQVALNFFCLSVIFLMVFIFLVVFFQIYTKRRIMTQVFIIIFGTLIWVIENYLMIPIVIYSTIYIKHSWFVLDDFVSVYDRNLVFDYRLGIFFLIQLIVLYILLLLNTIFNYTSAYSYETAYSRAHSVVSFKQISFLFFLSMAHILVSKMYFLYINILVGIFMVYNYLYYMPYYSNFDNLVDSGLWMTLSISSILSLVNEVTPGGFETVICLALMLPFIYLILSTKLKENLNKRSNLAEDSPYISELKIRKLCYMKKEIDESIIKEIRKLFNESTKKFIEFKLLFIWECNFEFKYSPSSALAMMKLLKSVFADKRPDFLKKPRKVFRSFPDIESQFFYYKLYKKINESSGIKDFSLLKYLKNYSKSNKLDCNACRKLIQLIDCNLESLRYSDEEIAKRVLEFSEAIQIKDSTLSRYLKRYNDESDYLSQYKNFKEQLFYSNDPNSKSQQDKRRESFIDKLMGFNTEQKVAKLIISGSPKEVGKIIYLNRNCLDLLGANTSAEILGRCFTFIIPPPYDKMHTDILQKFLLFGQRTDLRRNHMIITDIEGYSLEVSMHLSIAFHSQVPYFVLDLVPKSPKECIALLDLDGKILCFSEELNMIIKPTLKYIQELLPGIDKYFEKYSTNQCFMYHENGTNELLKRVEIDIDRVKFNILYFFEDECSFKFNHQLHNIPIRFSRQNSVLIKTRTRESEGIRSKKSSFVKRKVRTNEVINDKFRVRLADNSSKIERISNTLLLSQKIIFFSLAFIILAFTIAEMSITDNQKLCEIMNKIGLIRFSLTEISKNSRSVDLLQRGVETFYDAETYFSFIINSSRTIKNTLDDLEGYSKVYPILSEFKDYQFKVIRYMNGKYIEETLNLYESLLEVSAAANLMVTSNFTHQVSLFFIYNNCYQRIFTALNSSAYENIQGMMKKGQDAYKFIRSIKSILFVPLFFQVTVSIVILVILERINIEQWKAISSISTNLFLIVRGKAIDRMKNIHSNDEILDAFFARKSRIYCRCWKRYCFYTFLLCIFVLLYYVITAAAIEKPLSYIIDLKLNHRFWGGLRRSILNRSFIWARESQLMSKNSFFNLITDYVPVASFSESFIGDTESVMEIEKMDYSQIFELKAMDLDYHEYFNYMSKDGCKLKKIQNCSSTIISKGIHPAIQNLITDLHTFLENPSDPSLFKNFEFNNNLILDSLKLANYDHESISNNYFSIYSNCFIVACMVSICFLLIFYYLMQKPAILSIKNGLLSRNQTILMFQETVSNKTPSLNSTSNH